MIERLKFRGKDKLGRWTTSDYNLDVDPSLAYSISNFFALVYKGIIDPTTVGQWTGLVDKNGKEIYEGDIVAYRRELRKTNAVCWRYGIAAFMFGEDEIGDNIDNISIIGEDEIGDNIDNISIIGTIYDEVKQS